MTAEEFDESLRGGIARRAEDQVRHGIWSPVEAAQMSRAEFAQLLPQGRETAHFRFSKIIDAGSWQRVGEGWHSVEEKGGRVQFWLHWIWIEPHYRRRGYAKAVFSTLEREAVTAGADRLGLYVAADNKEALALYAELGFRTTNMRMAKTLPAPR